MPTASLAIDINRAPRAATAAAGGCPLGKPIPAGRARNFRIPTRPAAHKNEPVSAILSIVKRAFLPRKSANFLGLFCHLNGYVRQLLLAPPQSALCVVSRADSGTAPLLCTTLYRPYLNDTHRSPLSDSNTDLISNRRAGPIHHAHREDVTGRHAADLLLTSRTCLQFPRNSNPLQVHSRWPARP